MEVNVLYILVGLILVKVLADFYEKNKTRPHTYLKGDVVVRVRSELGSSVDITFNTKGTFYMSFDRDGKPSPFVNRSHRVDTAPVTIRMYHPENILPLTIGVGRPGDQQTHTFKKPRQNHI